MLVTLPLFFDPQRFYPSIGVGYCDHDSEIHWYHPLLTQFVHGTGCGFPPSWLHLTVNCSLFLFQGAIVERILGSARFALLTGTNLVVIGALSAWLVGGRSHGASGMCWSYGLFVATLLHGQWRSTRWHMFRDPVTCLIGLWFVLAIAGLVVNWHVYSLLVSVPFFLSWRKLFAEGLRSCSHQRTAADHLGIAFFAGVLLFNIAVVTTLITRA